MAHTNGWLTLYFVHGGAYRRGVDGGPLPYPVDALDAWARDVATWVSEVHIESGEDPVSVSPGVLAALGNACRSIRKLDIHLWHGTMSQRLADAIAGFLQSPACSCPMNIAVQWYSGRIENVPTDPGVPVRLLALLQTAPPSLYGLSINMQAEDLDPGMTIGWPGGILPGGGAGPAMLELSLWGKCPLWAEQLLRSPVWLQCTVRMNSRMNDALRASTDSVCDILLTRSFAGSVALTLDDPHFDDHGAAALAALIRNGVIGQLSLMGCTFEIGSAAPDIIAQALLAPTSRVYEFDFDPYDSYREWTAPICAAAASAPGITRFRTGPRFMPLPQEVEEWLELARRSDPGAGVVRDDGKGMLQLTLCKWAMPARSA